MLDQSISLVAGGTVMVIDFDLGRSFVVRGSTIEQNRLLFKPVIKATARDVTGSVSGTVRAGSSAGALVAGATVEVLKAGTSLTDTDPTNVIRSGDTDAQGTFKILYLLPGTYALRATPPSAMTLYGPVLQASATVTSGADTGGNLLILPLK